MKSKPRAWAYFDTSALVKRYIRERGSDRVQTLLRNYRVISSSIAMVEAASSFRQRGDSGDLERHQFEAILRRFDADRNYLELIEVSKDILDRAERLTRENKVRTLDAIHSASVSWFREETHAPVPLVTADSRQRDAAAELSVQLVWVE